MRVITTLDFLQHLFAKLGHRDLLSCDPSYLNLFSSSSAGVHARGSVRRDSGFVQISISLKIPRLFATVRISLY